MTPERWPHRGIDYGTEVVDTATGFIGIVDRRCGEEVLLLPVHGGRTPCGCPTTNALYANLAEPGSANGRSRAPKAPSGQPS